MTDRTVELINAFAWTDVEFREVVGFPDYRVGSNGMVYSSRGGRGQGWKLMIPSPNLRRYGYLQVPLYDAQGRRQAKKVHHLVLEAFVGPRPDGMEACHFPDPDPSNCDISNLRWDTPKANKADARKLGRQFRGGDSPMAKLGNEQADEARSLRASGKYYKDIAMRYGVDPETIRRIVVGKTYKGQP